MFLDFNIGNGNSESEGDDNQKVRETAATGGSRSIAHAVSECSPWR